MLLRIDWRNANVECEHWAKLVYRLLIKFSSVSWLWQGRCWVRSIGSAAATRASFRVMTFRRVRELKQFPSCSRTSHGATFFA